MSGACTGHLPFVQEVFGALAHLRVIGFGLHAQVGGEVGPFLGDLLGLPVAGFLDQGALLHGSGGSFCRTPCHLAAHGGHGRVGL